ncbi:GTD-binding domain-containing protein [Psidium guajava]|nr:GTD-binding domain-containing protein [Psidium guajava]
MQRVIANGGFALARTDHTARTCVEGTMECEGMRFWTFSGLVGAFLDLAIAYSLLCAATLAYFTSKFLGVFGLCLPCPCNGLFGHPNGDRCVRKVLVDRPSDNIYSVQMSVKNNFPFDTVLINDRDCEMILEQEDQRICENGHLQLEGEASCSSYEERRERDVGVQGLIARNESDAAIAAVDSLLGEEGRFDFKGEGSQRTKGLRRRKKGSVEDGKFSSVSSYDPWQADAQYVPSPSSMRKFREQSPEESLSYAESQFNCVPVSDKRDALMDSALHDSKKTLDLHDDTKKNSLAFEEFGANGNRQSDFGPSNKDTVRPLEQILEEERSARHALYLELEKERNAAATAADEAMAMILRLQADKASIEMEARQYQRMIEEKSAYDAEEMNILKEILLRREKERHFLENEVESYRQMIFANERLDDDLNETVAPGETRTSSLISSEDPELILQRIGESPIKNEKPEANNDPGFQVHFVPLQNCTVDFDRELQIPERLEDDKPLRASCTSGGQEGVNIGDLHLAVNEINQEVQEKIMLSADNNLHALQEDFPNKSKQFSSRGFGFRVENDAKENELLIVNSSLSRGSASDINETLRGSHMNFPLDGGDMETDGRNADINDEVSKTLGYSMEPCVHDVHVISDEPPSGHSKVGGGKGAKLTKNASLNNLTSSTHLGPDNQGTGLDMNRSSSDASIVSLQGQSLPSYLRRNSMSAVDYERMKIDNEVGWLRERLKIVQKGREKLNISAGNRERGKNELQLLENIVSQLREIREMTEHGKAERRASLPPVSSKATAKKRRWRSVSLGMHRST